MCNSEIYMNKIAIVMLTILLSACYNIEFDSLEYDRYVFLKQTADNGIKSCGSTTVVSVINKLKQDTEHQFLYSFNRSDRPQIAEASAQLKDMVDRLYIQYQNKTPSLIYCQEKLINISTGTGKIIEQLGRF